MTTLKFYDADGNEFDTGIEQPNDPDFDAILAAEYTTGKQPRLSIARITAGRREYIAEQPVSGKREALMVAAALGATPWNF